MARADGLSPVSWINPNGGDWDTASNWSNDAIPIPTDDVTISIGVSKPITHDMANADAVNSVTSDDPIILSAGSLSIAAASAFGNTFTLSGGTLSGGPISFTNGATLVGTGSGGTLAGVTLDGTLDLATNGGNVTITGGLTLNGTIDMGSSNGGSTNGQLNFVGADAGWDRHDRFRQLGRKAPTGSTPPTTMATPAHSRLDRASPSRAKPASSAMTAERIRHRSSIRARSTPM